MAPPLTSFGPDVPLDKLPANVRTCVTGGPDALGAALVGAQGRRRPGAALAMDTKCDEVMGSLGMGTGWCSEKDNAAQTYCACVNSPSPAAPCFFAACTNNAHAYQTAAQRDMLAKKECPANTVICTQVLSVEGGNNVLDRINLQCGVFTTTQSIIKANPLLAVLMVILLISLVMVIVMRPDAEAQGSDGVPLDIAIALELEHERGRPASY